jgi:hypothetical protein
MPTRTTTQKKEHDRIRINYAVHPSILMQCVVLFAITLMLMLFLNKLSLSGDITDTLLCIIAILLSARWFISLLDRVIEYY